MESKEAKAQESKVGLAVVGSGMPLEVRTPDQQKHQRAVFDALDVNNDGGLSPAELREGLKRLRLPYDDNSVNTLMNELDTNKDGQVSFEEFSRFVVAREKVLRTLFDSVDSNHNGHLEPPEVMKALHQLGMECEEKQLKLLMHRMDTDRNGVVDFSEWRDLLLLVTHDNIQSTIQYWQQAAALDNIEGDGMNMAVATVKKSSFSDAWKGLLAGAIAGTLSRTGTAPFERLKVFYQLHKESKPPNLLTACKTIYADGGLKGLFRGNGANVLKVAPEAAVKFYTFESMKRFFAPESDLDLSPWQVFVSGAVAGVACHASFFPLEVIKTRLMSAPAGTYTGIVHLTTSIIKNEGPIRPFFRGITPQLVSTVPHSGTTLMLYEVCKKILVGSDPNKQPGVLALMVAGTLASTGGQLISYPMHVVKSRLIVQGTPGQDHGVRYNGTIHGLKTIAMTEGVRGLYKGIMPSFFKSVPSHCITYVVYENLRKYFHLEKQKKH
eukprot:TRINITY_DN4351_c0_g1_i1.p1 TRINITY_DN4351_c0_g1~~TRINITY_DN4351_c0_g1_i1.p1  ORF type:complete len:495 (+),score=80.44 TRINITY_DN4351_c0_g1_i1:42-1526(+)